MTIKERFEFHLRKCTESSKESSSVITTDKIKISDKIDLTESSEKSKVKKNKSIVVLEEKEEQEQEQEQEQEKSTKVKKNKSKVVLEEEEQEEEEEIITIDDIKYIKEGLDIYRIKAGIKYKLYG